MLSRDTFNLIPIRDKSKIPLIAWAEFKNKKYDGDIKTTNYAVICGEVSRCVVIDIDSPELTPEIFQGWEELKKKTLVVKTGSGGYHIYVKPNNKDLSTILNYEEVVNKIRLLVKKQHHELIEDLAENIFEIIFQNRLVKTINIKIEKLDIIKNSESVGIEFSKSKI